MLTIVVRSCVPVGILIGVVSMSDFVVLLADGVPAFARWFAR